MVDYDEFMVKEKADRPIGFPPSGIIRKNLENLYISIVGALDVGDFETLLKESADLSYSETRDKMIKEFGTPTELSQAMLKARTAESAAKLEIAEQEAAAEQRTLESEFAELDEIARRRLGENLELSRRNEELERELRLAKAQAIPPTTPPGLPVRAAPPPAPTADHGSMYQEYKRRISQIVTISDINNLADEIFEILNHKEFDKLTMRDIEELREELGKAAEARAITVSKIKPPPKPIRGLPIIPEKEEMLPARKRERREVPAYPIPSGKVQVVHVYTGSDTEMFTSMGEQFLRDFELENTIKLNHLLSFPDHWYTLSPWGKREVYGWDLGSAMREAVMHLHKFSWESLIRDYGIPSEYIKAWKSV